MYQSERIFIKKFLANLLQMGVKRIPFDNEAFYNGAEQMSNYFHQVENQMGRYRDELHMLFIRNPIGGAYDEFKNEISYQNERLMIFENPECVSAQIRLGANDVDYILDHGDIDIPGSLISTFAQKFCLGAGIETQ